MLRSKGRSIANRLNIFLAPAGQDFDAMSITGDEEMNDPIPFEKKILFLKQVCTSDLEEFEKLALRCFFPGYHERSGFQEIKPSEKSILKSVHESGHPIVQDANPTRRYSGDFSLPRSRYFTVCRNDMGDDCGLLLRELKTYSNPHVSGNVRVYDTTDSDPSIDELRAILKPGKTAIFCFPQELTRFPSPFRQKMGLDASYQLTQIAAVIPTRVVEIYFERLIDLRMPATRHWFVREFTRLKNTNPPTSVFAMEGPLDDFKDLLPTLLSQILGGGSGPTQAAGLWLRRLGAEGLIFPSARADISVTISSGKLHDWYGWNLVDYRGAPHPAGHFMLSVSPAWHQYPLMHHEEFEVGEGYTTTPMAFSHVEILSKEDGPYAGSLSVNGIELARNLYHDIDLWSFYTDRMEPDLKESLVQLTLLAASDGEPGIYVNRWAAVCRIFLDALHGDSNSKKAVTEFPALPHIGSWNYDYATQIKSFLALCD